MKIFLFGDGKWSKNQQRILNEISDIRLLVFDIDTTPDEAIAHYGTPDAAIITASTENHFPLTKYFLECGTPVFCEKPIYLKTHHSEWFKNLIRLNEFIPPFMAGHQLTFDPIVSKLADESPVFFSSKRTGAIPRSEGAVMSLAVHDIAIAMHLFGHSEDIEFKVSGNQHTAQIVATWPGGMVADIYVQSIAQVQLRHAVVVTQSGKVHTMNPSCWSRTDLVREELLYFISCVQNEGTPSRNGLIQALLVTDLAIKIRDKIATQPTC